MLASAWSLEAEAAGMRRQRSQTDFLPAALEVIETPASPFGRVGLWLLIVGVGLALLWSFIGKLDVVVVAPGRIIPVERVKVIQPSELGVVRAIHVRDGQRVKAGQLLIELDPTASGADAAQARTGLTAAQLDRARSEALLSYLRGQSSKLRTPAGMPSTIAATQRQLVETQIQEYEARLAVLQRQRGEHAAELAAANAERRKLEETLPLLDRQIEGRRKLVERGYFPRLRMYELEEQRIERVRNIDVQRAAGGKAGAAIGGINAQIAQVRSELARSTVKDLADAQDNSDLRANEIAKTQMRNKLMRLTSPVDGTVQQLAVHTLGGIVEPAQALLVIVPSGSALTIEAKVANKDSGFLHLGQNARIKVDAFPFTEFGTLQGALESISTDAVEDRNAGLIYIARIRPKMTSGTDTSAPNRLVAGMSVTVELVTGRRRVADYILSPLWRRFDEAGRER